jgi:hypothetical protein
MMKAKTDAPSVFVLEIAGEPILAFRATTFGHARELAEQGRLQQDLKRMTVGHRPLWDGKAPIKVRRAQPAEAVYYVDAKAENAAGDLPFVYLVRRDDEAGERSSRSRGAYPPGR